MTPTAIYRSIMVAVEDRRQQLGLPMWQVDEFAGTQDGYYAKMLHADAASGRQGRWETLQLILDALFPEGFDLKIIPGAAALIGAPRPDDIGAPRFKQKLRHITAHYSPKTRRELMSELGKKGCEARLKKYSRRELGKFQKKAQRARRQREKEARRLTRNAPGQTPIATPSECRGAVTAPTTSQPAKARRPQPHTDAKRKG